MRNRRFTIAAAQMAVFFWVLESAIHFFVFEEPQFELIPGETNEFWMRVVIAFLVLLLGVFADAFVNKIVRRQMEVAHAYNALIQAGTQTMENLVQQMQLFHMEAQKSQDFDPKVLHYFENAVEQASDLIGRFANVDKALNQPPPGGESPPEQKA